MNAHMKMPYRMVRLVRNPKTYVGVVAVVSFVALVASVLPARRAASIDPVRSLRTE